MEGARSRCLLSADCHLRLFLSLRCNLGTQAADTRRQFHPHYSCSAPMTMTRADKSRLLYALAILLAGGIGLAVSWYFGFRPSTLIVIAILLIIPGRIPALLWREFYTGQRAMQLGDHELARASYIAFLEKVRAQPWLKRLMYVKWGVHTWDIEAMALNNLGSTFVEKGEPQQAIRWYEAALAVDPEYGA